MKSASGGPGRRAAVRRATTNTRSPRQVLHHALHGLRGRQRRQPQLRGEARERRALLGRQGVCVDRRRVVVRRSRRRDLDAVLDPVASTRPAPRPGRCATPRGREAGEARAPAGSASSVRRRSTRVAEPAIGTPAPGASVQVAPPSSPCSSVGAARRPDPGRADVGVVARAVQQPRARDVARRAVDARTIASRCFRRPSVPMSVDAARTDRLGRRMCQSATRPPIQVCSSAMPTCPA